MSIRRRYVQVEKTRHGKSTFYFRRNDGPRVRLPAPESPSFMPAYQAALSGKPIPHVRDMPASKIGTRRAKTKKLLAKALRAAQARSRKKGLPCELDLQFLFDLAEAQNYRCALTGIEFFFDHHAKCRVAPYVPSIDRINPKRGYVRDNVRLTVFAVNAMMLDWGEDVFQQVANSYRYWRTKR